MTEWPGGCLAASHGGRGLELESSMVQKELQKSMTAARGAGICTPPSFSIESAIQVIRCTSADSKGSCWIFWTWNNRISKYHHWMRKCIQFCPPGNFSEILVHCTRQIFLAVQRGASRSGEGHLYCLLLLQSYWSPRRPRVGIKAAFTALVFTFLFHILLPSEHQLSILC